MQECIWQCLINYYYEQYQIWRGFQTEQKLHFGFNIGGSGGPPTHPAFPGGLRPYVSEYEPCRRRHLDVYTIFGFENLQRVYYFRI